MYVDLHNPQTLIRIAKAKAHITINDERWPLLSTIKQLNEVKFDHIDFSLLWFWLFVIFTYGR